MSCRRSLVGCLAVVAVVVCSAPSYAASKPKFVDPGLAAQAGRDAAAEAPFLLPSAPRILLIGDSIADSLASGIASEAQARGARFTLEARPGCGFLPGVTTVLPDHFVPSWSPACAERDAAWHAQVAATPADLILWLSTVDGSARTVGTSVIDPDTSAGDQAITDLTRTAIDQIAPPGSGRHVVLMVPGKNASGPNIGGAPDQRWISDVRGQVTRDRAIALSDRDRVRTLDLGRWLCATGDPCPTTIDGVAPRPGDGGHFSREGAAWIAPKILDALGIAPLAPPSSG